MTEARLPELAEGVNEAVVTLWHVKVGDKIEKGQDLVEMATDKAVFNVPSPVSGVIKQIVKNEGDQVKVGETLAGIE